MEIYNSEKKVDIGLGLLTNPNKKKKTTKTFYKINTKEENNTDNKDEISEINNQIIEEFTNILLKKKNNDLPEEYNELMESLVNTQIKLIKYKNFLEKIDNLQS